MEAVLTYRCVCGAPFLVGVHAPHPEEPEGIWAEIANRVAMAIGAPYVESRKQIAFICGSCGTLHLRSGADEEAPDNRPDGSFHALGRP